MKTRQGFVSNSSSSSFIVGIVNTGPNGEGEEFLPRCKESPNAPYPFSESLDITEKLVDGARQFVISARSSEERVSVIANPGDHIVGVAGSGPCPDDYEDAIPLEDFESADIQLYERIVSLGGEAEYGEGYNG